MLGKVLDFLRERRFRRRMQRWSAELDIADSAIIGRSFVLEDRFPTGRTRVSVGADSVLGCTCIFESTEGSISVGARTSIGGGRLLFPARGLRLATM